MVVAIVAGIVGLIVVLYAVYADPPLRQRATLVADWEPLPDPTAVSRVEFPLSFPGYDPATVEAVLGEVTGAYADLLAAAPAEAVAEARRRAALRTGRGLEGTPAATARARPGAEDGEGSDHAAELPAGGPRTRARGAAVDGSVLATEDTARDDLRAEAALARLEERR